MNNSNPSLITLQQASLCLDCEMLTAAHKNCLACVSRALLSVARALSRPEYAGLVCLNNTAMAEVPTKRPVCGTDFLQSI
jgi:hypothetical protein